MVMAFGHKNIGWLVEPVGELYPFSLLLWLWCLGIRCCRWCCCCRGCGRPRLQRRSSRRWRLYLHVAPHHHRDLEGRFGAKTKESLRPDVDLLPSCNRVSTGPEASSGERADPRAFATSCKASNESTDASSTRCFLCGVYSSAICLAGERFGDQGHILRAIWRRQTVVSNACPTK